MLIGSAIPELAELIVKVNMDTNEIQYPLISNNNLRWK